MTPRARIGPVKSSSEDDDDYVGDDGANDSYELEIMIESDNEKVNNNWNYGSIVVLLGLIGFSILMFSRMKSKDSESKSLPKWNETVTNTDQDVKQVDSHESELWD